VGSYKGVSLVSETNLALWTNDVVLHFLFVTRNIVLNYLFLEKHMACYVYRLLRTKRIRYEFFPKTSVIR
jgi:hypothetical protein